MQYVPYNATLELYPVKFNNIKRKYRYVYINLQLAGAPEI